VDRTQRHSNKMKLRECANAQAMVPVEAKLKEKIGESMRQFPGLSGKVSLHAR